MTKGQVWPPETRVFADRDTGRRIRQITDHPSQHHHPFFFVPAHDDRGRYTVFVSHRTGAPQLFVERRNTGELVQLTDRDDISEWSLHPAHGGGFVVFVAGNKGWRLDIETLDEDCLVDFGSDAGREKGMVGAAMGTTTLSRSDRYWAVPVKRGEVSQFYLVDVESGESSVILERDTIGHPQFCPDDDSLIFFAGPITDRLWLVNRDGSGHRRLWQREHALQWITHEFWLPGRREVGFVDWPHGLKALSVDTEPAFPRVISEFPAWHSYPDADGGRIVCDTNFPDIGLHLLPLTGGDAGVAEKLCNSDASSVGAHWEGPFPYNDGPVSVYAPQHTHPHPRFTPDGRCVIFTSDVSGHSQLYEVQIEAETA